MEVPLNTQIRYRFFISAFDPHAAEPVHVRKWETHLKARTIETGAIAATPESPPAGSYDTFGELNGVRKVDRGWLTSETTVQLVFFKNPFLLKASLKDAQIFVKVTPVNLWAQDTEDSLSHREDLIPGLAFVDVATLGGSKGSKDEEDIHSHFVEQSESGKSYSKDDVLVFHVTLNEPENVAYLIDLYSKAKDAAAVDPPTHLGYHYILPSALKGSEGVLDVPVACTKRHMPLGMMQVEYLVISPLPAHSMLTLERSYIRHWNNRWTGLEVGHRGSGTSFKATDTVIRENTIASLKKAAQNGADMVEFDVQLSKDLVPVVYHDFNMYVSVRRKAPHDTTSNDMLALPMSELTLAQMQSLKVYHTQEAKNQAPKFFDEDLEEHQPFPTLVHVLETIDEHVGFNVEIKWSQRLEDGTTEATNRFDKNLYLDKIVEVVLKHAKKRRIVFSCFDADVVTMLRLKQNLYPVMFLTVGSTKKWPAYYDPRCTSHRRAIEHAQKMELLGIVGHTDDLLQDTSLIKETIDEGLVIFSWGDDNNNVENIRLLKGLGLHAIIYDRMEELTTKEKRENVFWLKAQTCAPATMQTEV